MNPIDHFISIIVAVKNEEKYISQCLDSLINQDFKKDKYQIIVVDGKSNDETVRIVEKYIKKYPDFIKLYNNPKEWQSAGRNIAIKKEKKSDLFAYIDGHCIADKNWLKNLYNSLTIINDEKIGGVGSIHKSPKDEKLIGRAIEQIFSSAIGGAGSSYIPSKQRKEVNTAPFVLYTREALQTAGLYDEDMKYGEDYTLNYKIRKKGYKIYIEPNAIVYYYKRNNVKSFLKQMYNYGIAKAVIGKRYPNALKLTHILPCILLSGLIIIGSISLYLKQFLPLFLIGLIFYSLAIIFYSLKSAFFKKQSIFAVILPMLFISEHFAYSIGFLRGCFKKRWTK